MPDSFLFRNGSIFTMDPVRPWAQAMVVRGSTIAYVGPADRTDEHVDAGTELVNLRGGMCLPGFVDAHNHLASLALTKLGVSVLGLTDREAIVANVADWVAAQRGDAPLRGHGWVPDSFGPGGPRREWLDEITGDRPMYLFSVDAHNLWFNSAAMRLAGVGPDTPDPNPGSQYWVRDADGTPSGLAVEGAASIPIAVASGLFSPATVRASQELTIGAAPSYGMTSYYDAGIIVGERCEDGEWVVSDLMDQDLAGQLPLRVVASYWTRDPSDDPVGIAAGLADWNARLRSEHVSVSACKMWSDGGLFSGTSLMLQPCRGHRNDDVGQMTFPPETIAPVIEAVQRAGFDMHVHVDGDGSLRAVLDAIESVHHRIGSGDSRHTVAHNTVCHPDDVARFAPMGVIANCTPLWGTDYNGQYYDIYEQLLGAELMDERLMPYGDLVRSGARVTYGSDIPGVDISEIPPLIQIEAAVTRQRPGHPEDRVFVPRQRVGVLDALRAYTTEAAYQLRMEDRIGSLEVGKAADVTVLAADLFRTQPHEIHAVPVVLTMMDGRVTHDARS